MSDLAGRTVAELSGLLRADEVSATELTTACLDAIDAREATLHAWTIVDAELALARARELDGVAPENRGPLHGIPVGVKDIIDTADLPTAYGSAIYADHRPDRDADVVARLRTAGAVILGKTVTTEFALFQPGPTTNPHDPARTPGGSSSGSAAAVGAGTVPVALGTQTAGSVVRPAAFCGVVGVKPTFGVVPTRGVKACAPSLDTVGVFARDVDGAAHVLRAIGGVPHEATGGGTGGGTGRGTGGVARQQPYPTGRERGLRVGFTRTHDWGIVPRDTRSRIEAAADRLARDPDVDMAEVDLPEPFGGLTDAQTFLMLVEVSRSLRDERARHGDRLSPRLREILAAGDRAGWAYDAALARIHLCRGLLDDVFAPVDVLLAPAVLGEAPPLESGTGDPVLCRMWTALGTPAVAVPGLTGPAGLPLGLQVIAPPGRDDVALRAARQVAEVLASDAAGAAS
ncbi:amidase [Phytoactinopolyspora halotolerans]|uniref:Amidase n=1 Tax=Phytoactinopolyspora halotolerans TaxID=1981512 RepID=A0A6L9SAJ0_9ACTN|nr:amidase [Phytoactinopolyspora halotolerans]NEE02129.1 amidase [Phytoactinopolyspora halotolerans]